MATTYSVDQLRVNMINGATIMSANRPNETLDSDSYISVLGSGLVQIVLRSEPLANPLIVDPYKTHAHTSHGVVHLDRNDGTPRTLRVYSRAAGQSEPRLIITLNDATATRLHDALQVQRSMSAALQQHLGPIGATALMQTLPVSSAYQLDGAPFCRMIVSGHEIKATLVGLSQVEDELWLELSSGATVRASSVSMIHLAESGAR